MQNPLMFSMFSCVWTPDFSGWLTSRRLLNCNHLKQLNLKHKISEGMACIYSKCVQVSLS